MEKTSSRREFLKTFPYQMLKSVRSVIQGEKLPQTARIHIARCLAWHGMNCQFCYLACPLREQAIQIHDQKPVIIASSCDGCGFCQQACQTVNDLIAIEMVQKEG
ncbi:MAG: hypothetical protein HYS56_03465 [Candidatus Omnitrophica bacterium]|nr:hypothetical protein [Candidatus Omnitrophota bacterium]